MQRIFKLPDAGSVSYTAPSCEVLRLETEVFTMTSVTIPGVTEESEDWD